jgi:FMN-dependent NADH-azoreductase
MDRETIYISSPVQRAPLSIQPKAFSMTNLLHIASSPRKERSASLEVANAFIGSYRERHPETDVVTLDLWNGDLPEFDEHAMAAKYAGLSGTAMTPSQEAAWSTLRELANHLHRADVVVLSVPLWNFSIPYKLKHFIDLVSQKDILFGLHPERGFEGLLHNKAAVVVYARGLDYSSRSTTPAERFDFQKPYVEAWLKFIGITDVHSLIVEKTIFDSKVDRAARLQATAEAQQLARGFRR